MPLGKVVDTLEGLQGLLTDLAGMPLSRPNLFVSLEARNLGRHGRMSHLSVYVKHMKIIFIVDLECLGIEAFLAPRGSDLPSLQDIFESDTIPKVFFDARRASDALNCQYGVRLACVKELQVMELALRVEQSRIRHANLPRCVRRDAICTSSALYDLEKKRIAGRTLLAGNPNLLFARPIRAEVRDLAVYNVTFLPSLWRVYNNRLRSPDGSFWRSATVQMMHFRLVQSQSDLFDSYSPSLMYSAWTRSNVDWLVEFWNRNVSRWAGGQPTLIDSAWFELESV